MSIRNIIAYFWFALCAVVLIAALTQHNNKGEINQSLIVLPVEDSLIWIESSETGAKIQVPKSFIDNLLKNDTTHKSYAKTIVGKDSIATEYGTIKPKSQDHKWLPVFLFCDSIDWKRKYDSLLKKCKAKPTTVNIDHVDKLIQN